MDTLIYTAFGVWDGSTVLDGGERQNLPAFIYNKLPGLVREGGIKPNGVTKWEEGVGKVPDAIGHLAAGKVSGGKLVFGL